MRMPLRVPVLLQRDVPPRAPERRPRQPQHAAPRGVPPERGGRADDDREEKGGVRGLGVREKRLEVRAHRVDDERHEGRVGLEGAGGRAEGEEGAEGAEGAVGVGEGGAVRGGARVEGRGEELEGGAEAGAQHGEGAAAERGLESRAADGLVPQEQPGKVQAKARLLLLLPGLAGSFPSRGRMHYPEFSQPFIRNFQRSGHQTSQK
mmetsp:Transcript_11191/g.28291  ORF Transcript_11191/g.28291 Transcript_11191/m.28291 type:complete len:206 (+) Transcript_11191:734-1351(+)